MKLGKQTVIDMLNPKHATATIRRLSSKWLPPPCCKSFEGCISVIHHPILMRFGTHTFIDEPCLKNASPTA
jgi:hypothetical protein